MEPTMTDKAIEAAASNAICQALLTAFPMSDKTADSYAAVAVKAISAYLSALPGEVEVRAYEYELATRILEGVTGKEGYASFEKRITDFAPQVPEGALRNLQPLVTLAALQAMQARAEKAEQANKALMAERTNLIETKRGQIARLTALSDALGKELESLTAKALEEVSNLTMRAEAAERERDAFRDMADGYGKLDAELAIAERRAEAAEARVKELEEALKLARDTIKVWHGPNAWEIYDRASPEMEKINTALKGGSNED